MRILFVHNHYLHAGGEDASVAAEMALLRDRGHDVQLLEADNRVIRPGWNTVRVGCGATYSWSSRRRVAAALRAFRPDVVHVQNFFPLFSPSIYDAARAAGVPVVQALRNYRLICPNALLFRDGHLCTDCVGRAIPWPGVLHACYRASRPATAAVATMIAVHRLGHTWSRKVDLFVALTAFQRDQLVAGGLPAEKIVIKPNFLYPDPGPGRGGSNEVIFVGRLAAEKGLDTLLAAWRQLTEPIRLRIAGDGPLRESLRRQAAADGRIEWLGQQPLPAVCQLLQSALALVLPTHSPETFGRAIIEAYATGLPVIVSNLGGQASLVREGVTGRLFPPGDAGALAAAVRFLYHHPAAVAAMRQAARAEFEAHYTAAQNYAQLLTLYQRVLSRA